MRKSVLLFLWYTLFFIASAHAKSIVFSKDPDVCKVIKRPTAAFKPSFIDTLNGEKRVFHKKHRLFAVILALPPFGLFGLHRIYMHTSTEVPLVYIATFGGVFYILPFIDLVLILLSRDIHLTYTSNPHLFMWQKR